MLQRIAIDELKPGMYVNRVIDDKNKVKVRSKGVVRSALVIDKLIAKGVDFVEIDTSKGAAPEPLETPAPPVPKSAPAAPSADSKEAINSDGLESAQSLFNKAKSVQQRFLQQLGSGKDADVNKLTALTEHIIDGVLENQAATVCLSMVQRGNDLLLEHSLNCSIYMAILAEAAGFDKEAVEHASLAGLLMDTGMAKIPRELCIPFAQLSTTDALIYQTHIDESLAVLQGNSDIPQVISTIISQHHERLDGTGYPHGLKGDEIHPLAQIAAVVDEYSQLGMPAPFGKAYPNSKVLKSLAQNKGLDQSLVNRLIGVLGVYPIGSLVKLQSGKLGIISRKNPASLLHPQVMTFYSINSGNFQEIKRIDLAKSNDEIESSIGPDEFSINLPKFFSEVFINQVDN
ncbi:HD-GYP domain-containing protein [Alteromonas gilva]|uniref:DUF3391 domain-containing protein n=1 Tax=Alteromonas gilva TaxID=2987522 RepID=A0ABT5L6Z1_9ALTE|nr:HD domain-containing phosphohydrolase [Alteromonas gilva]MDC8832648.1 DUF3391 domain-containing protein [Alteromonas gilva]